MKAKFSTEACRSFTVSLLTFSLSTRIEKMNHKLPWLTGDLHSMVLLNRPDKQMVLPAFEKRTEITSFQHKELMILLVVLGK